MPKKKREIFDYINFCKTGVNKQHKIEILNAIHQLVSQSKKPFGMLIIVGWRKNWERKHALIPDASQNIIDKKREQMFNRNIRTVVNIIKKTKYFDGAILIQKNGYLISSGIYLTGLQPHLLVEHLGKKLDGDFSSSLGFKDPVHARHLVAITASWQLRDTTVYTVSEEKQTIRVYENSQIIYSTISEEVWDGEKE